MGVGLRGSALFVYSTNLQNWHLEPGIFRKCRTWTQYIYIYLIIYIYIYGNQTLVGICWFSSFWLGLWVAFISLAFAGSGRLPFSLCLAERGV